MPRLRKSFIPIFLTILALCNGKRCDQTPPQATNPDPSENKGIFKMIIETKMENLSYMPEQTYVVSLMSTKLDRPFRWFMITAEDPAVDDSTYIITSAKADVGNLKTLDTDTGKKSRYSERCSNSVESVDFSDKYRVDIHWISPRASQNKQVVRLRAMVAENDEVWYMDDPDLIILLHKDDRDPIDSPPTRPMETCNVCSEARVLVGLPRYCSASAMFAHAHTDGFHTVLRQGIASLMSRARGSPNTILNLLSDKVDSPLVQHWMQMQVIFYGKWSRVSHPQYYPSKPDENGYTHMVGASHANDYILWDLAQDATRGLKELVENANTTFLEQEIVSKMSVDSGTRTLIRGKRRHHPDMFEPSHSLFRVDRVHHRFSIVVGMRPSPDWFLGTSQFELCTIKGDSNQHGWYEEAEIPLYPWDAGTMNGVSYESPRDATIPQDKVKRVEVGSFNKASPFYQMNLNDLKPFAQLKVRLLDVYPLPEEECGENEDSEDQGEATAEAEEAEEEADEPSVAESKLALEDCLISDWSEWSQCVPLNGACGVGQETRTRDIWPASVDDEEVQDLTTQTRKNRCYGEEAAKIQKQYCYVKCE